MAVEHEALVQEYQKYKNELAEYEKQKYFYENKVSEYAEEISKQIKLLLSMGVEIPTLKNVSDVDLTDENIVRSILNDVYEVYNEKVNKGLELLKSR